VSAGSWTLLPKTE